MRQYQAREFIELPLEQIWQLSEERFTIAYEDGITLESHTREAITMAYLWMVLRHYKDVPVESKFALEGRRINSGLILEIINNVVWAIEARHPEAKIEALAKNAFDAINSMYNDMTVNLAPEVATLSLFDVVDLMRDPVIDQVRKAAEPTPYSIEQVTYPQLKNRILDPDALRDNPIANSAKSGTISMGQLLQCIGPRGFVTDINSDIFPEPIMRGFFEGLDTLHDALIESRSGAKSLLFNKELLPGTEYFNRETQLNAQYLQRLHPGDCGTPHTIEIPVIGKLLPSLKGKYYYDSDNQLRLLQGTEKHLIDTTIRMRSVLGCMHPDPGGICETCYGRLARSIPHGTNVGQVSAVKVGDTITSKVLSTKHQDATSNVERMELHETEQKYLRYGGHDTEKLYLQPNLEGSTITVRIRRGEMENLSSILFPGGMDQHPSSISELTDIGVEVVQPNGHVLEDVLVVSLFNRKSSLSRSALSHLKEVGWSYDDKGNYVLDFSKFDIKNKPFLELPNKHVNMYEFMVFIKRFLQSGSDSDRNSLKAPDSKREFKRRGRQFLNQHKDPVEALTAFSLHLNERFSINVVHCEVLLYTMMVRDKKNKDYRLPIPGIYGQFEKYSEIITGRSLSAAMAYQTQYTPLKATSSFTQFQRNDHPYDLLLMGGRLDS